MKLSPQRQPELDTKKVEEVRGAKFVGILPVRSINQPVYVFYNKEKHPRGSHYFGLTHHRHPPDFQEGIWVILDAGEVEGKTFSGILRPDGTILHSYYRHDYVEDSFGNMVDGGEEYCRYRLGDKCQPMSFTFKDGELVKRV